jgi:hypothetical protein
MAVWDGSVGRTALQPGRSRVGSPMGSVEFFIDPIFRSYYGLGEDSASNRNEYQRYLLGGGGGGGRCPGLTTSSPACADYL